MRVRRMICPSSSSSRVWRHSTMLRPRPSSWGRGFFSCESTSVRCSPRPLLRRAHDGLANSAQLGATSGFDPFS